MLMRALLMLILVSPLLISGGCDDPKNSETDARQDAAVDGAVDTPAEDNRPPVLKKIGDRRAGIGKTLRITPEATDPDGDALTYSVFGDLPPGAKFVKDSHTFEWTPQPADDGLLVLLTFAVSDGQAEDRETLQITATTSTESTRPVLDEIGDIFLEVNTPFSLLLEATDEDGDTLTYSTSGPLPSGAALDGKTGRFTWTPSASQQGSAFRVLFVVTDGSFKAEAEARFIVQTAELRFEEIPPQSVALGDSLNLPLPIVNPLNHPFVCTTLGELPEGASFDENTCIFTYTPTDPALIGTSKEAVFQVQETGERDFKQIRAVTLSITAPVSDCPADGFEPNNSAEQLAPLQAGEHPGLSICNDEDWYVLELGPGDGLEILASFTHSAEGDLDLELFLADDPVEPRVAGDSATDDERVVLPPGPEARTVWLRVFEFSKGQNTYTLDVQIGAPSCANDNLEPNDSFNAPHDLGDASQYDVLDAFICPGEEDWFEFEATQGERLDVTLVFNNASGDLDLELYGPSGTLLAFAATTADQEALTLASLPETGSHRVVVYGYQSASTEYLLEILRGPGIPCSADRFEANNAPENAALLSASDSPAANLTYCGDDDFYRVSLGAGEPLRVVMQWTDTPASAQMHLLDGATFNILASASPLDVGGGVEVELAGGAARDVIVEVSSATLGLDYSLTLEQVAACDARSCRSGQVCGDGGQCVSDLCFDDAECPAEHACRQTYCAPACASNADCRQALGYACRTLAPADTEMRCALSGSGGAGVACFNLGTCSPDRTCLKGTSFPGGMCARAGCASDADCSIDGTCVQLAGGGTACLPFCFVDGDCRQSEGYRCAALPSAEAGDPTEVCVAQ